MFKLQLKDNPNRSIWLVGEKVTLGSHPDNTLVLDGLGIDEFHAELSIFPDSLILKSKPGSCIVNELPVDGEFELKANDELRIGKERLLIIDPQQLGSGQPSDAAISVEPEKVPDWILIPDHPKLKDIDFSIRSRSVLGRSKDCQLSVPYKLLSREHAELWIDGAELFVKDLGSANGCFVNGKRVQEAPLKNGDKVAFAKLIFTVQGPEEAHVDTQGAVIDEEEMNRTMIRPAINLEAELAARQASMESNSIQMELEPIVEEHDSDTQKGKGVTIAIVAGLILVAVVGVWFYLQSQ